MSHLIDMAYFNKDSLVIKSYILEILNMFSQYGTMSLTHCNRDFQFSILSKGALSFRLHSG